MPGRGNAMGHGKGHGGPDHADRGEAPGGGTDEVGGAIDNGVIDGPAHGRSASSPGHMKREAGAQSARDFAPGRTGKAGGSSELPENAPDDMAED